jgi:hypothetical protein
MKGKNPATKLDCVDVRLEFRRRRQPLGLKLKMARETGLEPATPGVTGRYSNQLSYSRAFFRRRNGEGAE